MFKRSIIICLIVGILAFPAPASAAAYSEPATFAPLAALSRLLDRLETILPFSAQTKALAHLRLAESKIEAVKGAKAGDAKAQLDAYRREMKAARKLAKSARGGAAERVDAAASKHLLVLEDLLNKVPDEAKGAIRHALEVSSRGIEKSKEAHEKGRGSGPKAKGQGKGRGPKQPKL